MSSPDWVLEPGATYPVEFAADAWLWNAEVTAAENSVTVALNDATFNQGLRLANDLEVRGAGATLHVPLNGSAAALDRLPAGQFARLRHQRERRVHHHRGRGEA